MLLDKHLEQFLGRGVDPYNVRHPVFDVLNFFGREALASDLIEQMNSGQPIGLFGLRKMGKSSLMRYMQKLMPCPTACLDLQAGVGPIDIYERLLNAWNNHQWSVSEQISVSLTLTWALKIQQQSLLKYAGNSRSDEK